MRPVKKKVKYFLIVLLFFLTLNETSIAKEIYPFHSLFPPLQQPWYFKVPNAVAVDRDGYVYVADTGNNCIKKFAAEGQFVGEWGKFGSEGEGGGNLIAPNGIAMDRHGDIFVIGGLDVRVQKFSTSGKLLSQWKICEHLGGEAFLPSAIAIDSANRVYLTDAFEDCVRVFTSDGTFIGKWGKFGNRDAEFSAPNGIAIDDEGVVYVSDTDNHRIQKFFIRFEEDRVVAEFVNRWGQEGKEDGNFNMPHGIAVKDGIVYVVDMKNDRVQKFKPDGEFVGKFGEEGHGEGKFYAPSGIALDSSGFVYIAGKNMRRIQKFTVDGVYITTWQSRGSDPGRFEQPVGIAMDSTGNLYVADKNNHRIQKFSTAGEFIKEWGKEGAQDGEFGLPQDVAVDADNFIYVADTRNDRIQKFDSEGTFIRQWGQEGDYKLNDPGAIAIRLDGCVFVTDTLNHRIQKYDRNGVPLISPWGVPGNTPGKFYRPCGIDVDEDGFVYVSDGIARVQKFYDTGKFVREFGNEGGLKLAQPIGIAVSNGIVYVADSWNHQIQMFDTTGNFVDRFGEEGTDASQLNDPRGICVGKDGKIYIAETENNRIQVFDPTQAEAEVHKAIVVAGGGPYDGNKLWDATHLCANFAYRTLNYRGLYKDRIYYLSPVTDEDLDHNGEADDIDAEITIENLKNALTDWASDADMLVIYMVDHGGNEVFRMNANDTLKASDVAGWLNTFQSGNSKKVMVVYDACNSGSWASALMPAGISNRMLMTSTSPMKAEDAHFISQGTSSFSGFFWTAIFNGKNVGTAFDIAKQSLSTVIELQTPFLLASEGLEPNTMKIGSADVAVSPNAPIIGEVFPATVLKNTNSMRLYASQVFDLQGISRVWAVIKPPMYQTGSSDIPILEIPSIDLMPTGQDRYEATYEGFDIKGTYSVVIYARNRQGNMSVPVLSNVIVEEPLNRRVILIGSHTPSDELKLAVDNNLSLAYHTLKFQGYSDENIFYLSPVTTSEGVDESANIENLQYAIRTWAARKTQDVVIYMIGIGDENGFYVSETELLTAGDLDRWLDELQSVIPGAVTLIYDANHAGSFLPVLTPPEGKQRLVIASTPEDKPAMFLASGNISFSNFFWKQIFDGANLNRAFSEAVNALSFITGDSMDKKPLMDDNGNGIGNERQDGKIAETYAIGIGIRLAEDKPQAKDKSADIILNGQTSATLWVENVNSIQPVQHVWAIILPPAMDQNDNEPASPSVKLELLRTGNRYENTYDGFDEFGWYRVFIYADDAGGNRAVMQTLTVYQYGGQDGYEPDDSPEQANRIIVNQASAELHNLNPSNDAADADWFQFYGISGKVYSMLAGKSGDGIDIALALYNETQQPMASHNLTGFGGEERWEWTPQIDGIYYVKVFNADSGAVKGTCQYTFEIFTPTGTFAGFLKGTIKDRFSDQPISNALIKTDAGAAAITRSNGRYLIIQEPGAFQLTVTANGYSRSDFPGIPIREGGTTVKDFVLFPESLPALPPAPLFPGKNAENLSLTPVLQIQHEGANVQTQWQISTDPNFSTFVLDIKTGTYLSELPIPELVLSGNLPYFWRTKSYGTIDESGWSETWQFKTSQEISDDSNGNGIPDDQELDSDTDLDGNGVPDNKQPNLTCIQTDNGLPICIKGEPIETVKLIESDELANSVGKPEWIYPGLIRFKYQTDELGKLSLITVYFSRNLPENTVWFTHDSLHGWQDGSEPSQMSQDRKMIVLEITDGGFGDADGTENGVVISSFGFAPPVEESPSLLMEIPSTGDVSGAGCFIEALAD